MNNDELTSIAEDACKKVKEVWGSVAEKVSEYPNMALALIIILPLVARCSQ